MLVSTTEQQASNVQIKQEAKKREKKRKNTERLR
jgi:hypothetical protein